MPEETPSPPPTITAPATLVVASGNLAAPTVPLDRLLALLAYASALLCAVAADPEASYTPPPMAVCIDEDDALTNWWLELLPITPAEAGTAAPFTCATVGFG